MPFTKLEIKKKKWLKQNKSHTENKITHTSIWLVAVTETVGTSYKVKRYFLVSLLSCAAVTHHNALF